MIFDRYVKGRSRAHGAGGHVRGENAIRDPLLTSRAMGISKFTSKGRFEEISRSTARWTKSHPCTKRWSRAMTSRSMQD